MELEDFFEESSITEYNWTRKKMRALKGKSIVINGVKLANGGTDKEERKVIIRNYSRCTMGAYFTGLSSFIILAGSTTSTTFGFPQAGVLSGMVGGGILAGFAVYLAMHSRKFLDCTLENSRASQEYYAADGVEPQWVRRRRLGLDQI